ncbi:AEC family transporter [Paenibacillus sp. JX-17]|uniref:AEC family transporter n=1 Tax=Paenibacillus lacisoli TaxID=3064525 RepID=A0ABT9CBQ9_9BACL|nr:AEC family transporter [Paenibacillus sp. JX-17]MDO7906310.1 AEC family transporter [Paenibacillus sp. JX-17]
MIQSILATLYHVIVPLCIPVIAGALLGRYRGLDTKPLLTLYLYVLSPAILFTTLINAKISTADIYRTLAFALLNLVLLWLLAQLVSRLLRLGPAETSGMTLLSTLTNSANYGLPLILLAFGQAGLDTASVFVVSQMVIANTAGVYFAARSQFSGRNAVKSVLALPAIYASLLAIGLRAADLHLPYEVNQGIATIAAAYSPVVLTILGAQMVKVGMPGTERIRGKVFWGGLAVRMVLGPLVSAITLVLLGISGTLFSVLFILAAMPVAVNAVALADRFNAAPALISRCILWTTLSSFIILPLFIVWVR